MLLPLRGIAPQKNELSFAILPILSYICGIMAGIYFHIPFCKTRCLYCDFFSSTGEKKKGDYVEAMCEELAERKDYLQGETIETIYFGGGTPSQLSKSDFSCIFNSINNYFLLLPDAEITLEANPDDLSSEKVKSLRVSHFNRISLGIQSFNDAELRFLNRRHDVEAAIGAVKLCRKKGFENISIDLMYGLPNQTVEIWEATIQQAINLNIEHISAYHLIYEEGTPIHNLLKERKIHPITEELSLQMFEILIDRLSEAGFAHYEISNFAKPGFQARHNSAYWNGTPYLGIGASAHSFDGKSRQWNARTLAYRSQAVEKEILSEKDQFNDFILTRLRTMQGINLAELSRDFDSIWPKDWFHHAQKHINNKLLEVKDNYLRLSRRGIFVSDGVMRDLML